MLENPQVGTVTLVENNSEDHTLEFGERCQGLEERMPWCSTSNHRPGSSLSSRMVAEATTETWWYRAQEGKGYHMVDPHNVQDSVIRLKGPP